MSSSILLNRVVAASFASVLGFSSPALSATATGSFAVRITITPECKLVSASDLDFGSHGVIDANVDSTSTITVQCTTGTPYNVGIGLGTGAGATLAARRMTGPASATIDYNLFRESTHTNVWGETIGTDTVSATGNGATQPITVYGRVAPQTTPATGAYSDTVAVTVTY
ncbi:spore coat U domain-containing protein [Phyllobacterium zundukense]|uniref:Spore coat protein U n=1 Tax=Phyllobacterium zundukense TaxID=1867719 RepID=A0A2N9VW04_9HYPH|nr:spore coat U domain-containing protein [Phyllobacterium zundukense]ATU91404.1 spore coat protein U [Phyllobacterium zundukense]PIO43672.1 spore coat protein U [Phyllobacterium zundukense]